MHSGERKTKSLSGIQLEYLINAQATTGEEKVQDLPFPS